MLNLKAETNNEKIILDYLNKNASEQLKEKINSGKKTLAQCWSYIISEARKLAKNNCACVDDATVFGWAIHFFEEDSIKAEKFPVNSEVKTVKTTTKQIKKKEVPKVTENSSQLSLFDMLG